MANEETGQQRPAAPEDRLFDADEGRLRDAAAHYIDVVHAMVRRQLDEGWRAEDALSNGLTLLEQWMEARQAIGFEARATAEQITALVHRLMKLWGRPKPVLLFHLEARPELGGLTPIEAYARHRIWSVERLVDQIELQAAREELARQRNEERAERKGHTGPADDEERADG